MQAGRIEEVEGCYLRRTIILLGCTSGRGIVLDCPAPLFQEYSAFQAEILRTYRAGDPDR